MAKTTNFLAFDLGAESGRAMLGQFDGGRLALTEVHRFANVPVRLPDGLHWDVLRLWHEIQRGLAQARQQAEPAGIGLDTWGVDFALLDRQGGLLGNPFHYRDGRSDNMLDEAFRRAGKQAIFDHTGIQFMSINTLYQLLSLVVAESPALAMAHTFLTIPDLFNYWLTGRKVSEFTIATTTQCYDPLRGDWATSLLAQVGIPAHIFPDIVPPGTVLGSLRSEWGPPVSVIAPACHDTGSAVAAVPATGDKFAWISSGTWSIMGAEVERAVINGRSLSANMTNEGGVNGTFRFSRNIMGLWLVQECRRAWAQQGRDYTYETLTNMAAATAPLQAIIDPDDADFLKPGDMPARIQAYCLRTGQAVPESRGAIVRCALESLALKYRWVLAQLEAILGYRLDPIHIIGGGTQNTLLNRFTADAMGRQVIAGPVEAASVGNVLVQAMALGHIGSLTEGRALVGRSFAVEVYEPVGDRAVWDEGYGRLLKLLEDE
ncbi:MAG: rhamnulokinase [Anaerolineales bacterium]|nr:rhamnulokinase [Anaerolineales bacterium]